MKIGDKVYVRGCVDEIRQDTIIIRNNGGSFGTIPNEVVEQKSSEDCISRKAAIDVLDTGLWGVEWDKALAIAMLKDLPSAEKKRGEWIVYPLIDGGRVELECPICGDTFIRAVDHKPHFCENCGADMRGDTE